MVIFSPLNNKGKQTNITLENMKHKIYQTHFHLLWLLYSTMILTVKYSYNQSAFSVPFREMRTSSRVQYKILHAQCGPVNSDCGIRTY